MLIRRHIAAAIRRPDRQAYPEYDIDGQQVMLDPWENADCALLVANAFGVSHIEIEGWNRIPVAQPMAPRQAMRRVLEDPATGFIYYRCPLDIERQQQWNENDGFRVGADQW